MLVFVRVLDKRGNRIKLKYLLYFENTKQYKKMKSNTATKKHTITIKFDDLKFSTYLHKMNGLEYYNRQKEDWSDKEIQDLRMEYERKEMPITQIADIHRRTPGSISYKLKNIGIITHNTLSRGYLDYKNSDLYKEIVESNKRNDAEKAVKKEEKLKAKTEKMPVNTPFTEFTKMRNEVAELKRDVKEMLRLMNALYDFESQ